ncbi:SDR family NAD(P)-dependent oxidoreductase [Luteipulveratus mongoliensis]|uniref:3-oxoacyl-ACP reductase n=1 Tax=Luteipulveratus mongoliensis TaxID=571913 RepID=A0A0K1JP34_9MICO|nr:SDR family oxidoreductase [Luteipulveratus mongoliensis]AKU18330.1 3-oxoacyl-ACP reductase [Luteipulveratus mongoliensis]
MDYATMFDLTGRKALVVGGAGGIGRAAVGGLAAHGAEVVVADVQADAAKAVADEVTVSGGSAQAYELNVLDPQAISQAVADLDPVDILVLTAAVNVRKRMLDYTSEDFDKVIGLNLKSSFAMISAFGRGMAERGSGSIIAFTSIRSITVEPGQSAYAATKAGLLQVVRTAAAELGPQGVRVNAVAPGVVETPLTQPILDNKEWADAYAAKSALGRWSKPDELAGAVVYLASDAASYVTGTQILVDGGWTAIDGRYDPPA